MSQHGFLETLAGWMGRRPLAASIDDTIAWGAASLATIVSAPVVLIFAQVGRVAGVVAACAALLAIVLGGRAVLAALLVRTDGQTPGLRAVGLRIVRADGAPLTFRRALRCTLGPRFWFGCWRYAESRGMRVVSA